MANYKFPKLESEQRFESLVEDCYRALYPHANVQKYGRKGQKQYGIDILVSVGNETYGIQCKNYDKISVSDIETILKECTYKPLDKLIIATAAQEDTKIADHIIEAGKNVPYRIEYLSWERICAYIEDFPIIYNRYYGQQKCIDDFKKTFVDIIKRYSVETFLDIEIEPITQGLNINVPGNLDSCYLELTALLHQNTEKRTEELYEKISQFTNCLDYYNGYLSLIMFPECYGENLCRFKYKRPDTYSELKKHEDDVYQYSVELKQLIDEIMRMS